MTSPIIQESNIFGATTISGSGFPTEIPSTDPTKSGKLIDHLRYIADATVAQAVDRSNWLGIAANSGQNVSSASFVQREYNQPTDISSAAIVSGWQLPQLPALLTLPSLPAQLQLDTGKLRTDWQTDIQVLQQSWMAQFLPSVTNVSALNGLFSSILDGTAQTSFETRLSTLETNITGALAATVNATLATLAAAIATDAGNLAANIAAQKANIAAALQTASDNTQNIAWQRARDAASREARRLEDEAATMWASRGFSLPPGALAAQILKQRQATLAAAQQAAAAAAVEIQKAQLEISRQTIDSWVRVLETQNRSEIESYRINVESYLKYAALQVEATKFNADLAVKHLGLTLDFTKFAGDTAMKYRLGVIEGMNNLIRAYAALRGNEVEYARAIAGAQQQAVAALVEYYRAAMQSADIGLRIEEKNRDNALRYIDTAARFIGTAVGHHVNAAQAAADAFAKVAAYALSGLNAIAVNTASG